MAISHYYLAIDLGTESGRTMLLALLEPSDMLKGLEAKGDFSSRLALQKELKAMTSNAVWDYYCVQKNAPIGMDFMGLIKDYELCELSRRS